MVRKKTAKKKVIKKDSQMEYKRASVSLKKYMPSLVEKNASKASQVKNTRNKRYIARKKLNGNYGIFDRGKRLVEIGSEGIGMVGLLMGAINQFKQMNIIKGASDLINVGEGAVDLGFRTYDALFS